MPSRYRSAGPALHRQTMSFLPVVAMGERALGTPPYPGVAVEGSSPLIFSAETFSGRLKGGLGEKGRPLVRRLVLIPALAPDPGFSAKQISTKATALPLSENFICKPTNG